MTSHSHTPWMTFWPTEPPARRPLSRGERVGLTLLFLYVLLAALALWSGLGQARPRAAAFSEEGLSVQHRLFLRSDVDHKLALRIPPALLRERRISVAVDRRYLEAMELKGTEPQLLAARFQGQQVELDFPVDARDETLVVKLLLRTVKAGAPGGEIGVVGGPAVHVRHFVSP